MRAIAHLLVVTSLSLLVACKSSKDSTQAVVATFRPTSVPLARRANPPLMGFASVSESMDDRGARAVQISSEIAEVVSVSRADCARMSANLLDLKDQISEMLQTGKAFEANMAQKNEFEEKYGKAITVAMRSSLMGATKCNSNVAVREFLQSIQYRR
jgi:hypothetical protein